MSVSVRRRLPWLILLLAVGGAAWMLVGPAGVLQDLGVIAREGPATEDEDAYDVRGEAAWDEAWDEAPRLIGRAGARAGDGYLRADGTGAAPGGKGAKIDPSAGATVRFGGVVRGTDGQPVVDVRVLLRPRGTDGAVREEATGANGRFALELPAGRYDVALKAPGLGGLNLPGYLVDGATGIEGEFTLQRAHRLEVGIRRDGIGIAGADVSANPLQGIGGEAAQTDETGTALFEGLVAGKYRVRVELDSGEQIIRTLDLRKDEALGVDMPPGIAVYGTIDDADRGGPIEGAEVAAWVRGPSGTWITVSTQTDANGKYELAVPQGRVGRFEVSAEGFAVWPDRKILKNVMKSLRGVASGKEVERHVTLTHGLSIAGRVTSPDGDGVEGVELSFKPKRGASLLTRTAEDGVYELAGVRSERYDVVVLTEGWFSERALRVRVPRLEPGSVHEYDLRVASTISVQGRVLHHDRSPASGTRVWITGGGRLLRAAHNAGRDLETFSDAQGAWRLSDLPAGQGVAVRAALGALEAKPRGLNTNKLPEKPIELVLAPTVSLKGTVTDITTRRPIAGARVVVRPRGAPGGRTAQTVRTDEQGTFEAFELIPGTWELLPSRAGYLVAEPRTEDLAGAEGEHEVALTLDPGLALAGTVATEQGRPLDKVRVTVSGTSRMGKRIRRSAITKGDGVFHLTGFETGDYKLVARRNGYRVASIPGLQGGEVRLDVQMKPRTK